MATPTSIDEVAPSILAAPGLYCTLSTCPLELANVSYVPNLAGNILFTSIFGLFLAVQLFLGIRYRTWGFLVGMIGGNCLEIIGYAGRIQMHYNPFREDPFLM